MRYICTPTSNTNASASHQADKLSSRWVILVLLNVNKKENIVPSKDTQELISKQRLIRPKLTTIFTFRLMSGISMKFHHWQHRRIRYQSQITGSFCTTKTSICFFAKKYNSICFNHKCKWRPSNSFAVTYTHRGFLKISVLDLFLENISNWRQNLLLECQKFILVVRLRAIIAFIQKMMCFG